MEVSKSLFSGYWGIEREGLRIDAQGNLSQKPHPFSPEEKQITVDFAEAQVELITGVHSATRGAYEELERLQARLFQAQSQESLWPFSLPGRWTSEAEVEIAQFSGSPAWQDQRDYRQSLKSKHGAARQVLSGIHINYSFGPDHPGGDYFALARNFLRFKPVLTYLLAGSPWLTEAYQADLSQRRTGDILKKSQSCGPWTTSVRQSPLGYSQTPEIERTLDIRFDSLSEYLEKLTKALGSQDGHPPLLSHEREFYSPIRPKGNTQIKGQTLESLSKEGVKYLEFRIFDLDPLSPLGMSWETLQFIELFILACGVIPSPVFQTREMQELRELEETLTLCSLGQKPQKIRGLQKIWKVIFPVMEELASMGGEEYSGVLKNFQNQMEGVRSRRVDTLVEHWRSQDPLSWGLSRAYLHKHWDSLELSTRILIQGADARGILVTLLDPESNFIKLEKQGRTEYIKQATKTSADSYVTALIMENKEVTKVILKEQGLRVPEGSIFSRMDQAMESLPCFDGRGMVVKPNSTNFGEGVTILDPQATIQDWHGALELAFSLDTQVLVEEFVPGLEFRFLVVGGKTRAVLHRIPANVIGDGHHTLEELVEIKNRHPWRGEGYKKPLEKINLGDVEREYLDAQGLGPSSILPKNQQVFLRKNSNISTGGDSLDFTDEMPQVYKDLAEKGAAAVGAQICGLDLILPDWRNQKSNAEYTILELNFNPALHIHNFPAQGKNRHVETFVLELFNW